MGQKNISIEKILGFYVATFLRVRNYHSVDRRFFV